MEKLVEFLTNKIGYTIAAIIGLLLPGMLVVFIWNREIYIEIGIIRLIILALAISCAIYVINLFSCSFAFSIQEKAGDRKPDIIDILGIPLVITNIEIYAALIYKLNNDKCTIIQATEAIGCFAILYGLVGTFPSGLKLIWNKIRKKKK